MSKKQNYKAPALNFVVDTRSRGWCITINNPSDTEIADFENIECTYWCYNIEHERHSTRHLQGYIHFKYQKSFKSIKKKLTRAHIEAAKGSPSDNRDYCGKEGSIKEKGSLPQSGKRNDLSAQACSINLEDQTIRETWPAKAELLINNKRKYITEELYQDFIENKKIVYITGKSRSGKTTLAHKLAGTRPNKIKIRNNFLIGYKDPTKNCIWDDFRDSNCPLEEFLNLTDKFTNTFNVKGGECDFLTELLIITSVKHPYTLYKNYDEDVRTQILGRIKVIDLNSIRYNKNIANEWQDTLYGVPLLENDPVDHTKYTTTEELEILYEEKLSNIFQEDRTKDSPGIAEQISSEVEEVQVTNEELELNMEIAINEEINNNIYLEAEVNDMMKKFKRRGN